MPRDIASPFSIGQPVPIEFFVGRIEEIKRLLGKVKASQQGRLQVVFFVGERGIGKTSLASLIRHMSSRDLQMVGVHAFLGGVPSLAEMTRRIFDRLLNDSVGTPWHEKVRGLFGKHIREVGVLGVKLAFAPPETELERIAHDFPVALASILEQLIAISATGGHY
jgi:AAA+ ATPase superfamily predicted ATPase